MSDVPLRARPLDAEQAAQRVRQIGVLADADAVRLLSALTSSPDGTQDVPALSAVLEVSADAVVSGLRALEEVGLVTPGAVPGTFSPSAEAWTRFGRILMVASPDRDPRSVPASPELAVVEGPPPVIERIADRLAYRFSSHFSEETVRKYVFDSYAQLKVRHRVAKHLPALTSRFASERLGALASARGVVLSTTAEVLFVCVQNAGRSQIAAAVLRELAGDSVHVRTAGSDPAEQIDPTVREALEEAGYSLVEEFPKPLTDDVVQAANVVITMGCGDACPIYPGRRYMDWKVEDPVGRSLEDVREIREDIAGRVRQLLAELQVVPTR
ncbi:MULTISPECIES: low molecular weight phosphatase family protein [unclassified Rathayibacter]|uniref:arsenate-mycothiol transferase ArsC n=1 Tax=unclassified Rathayibacter TaxID=2609250 RepID=UPI002157E19D|nr:MULTISPECIES: arsenate reductase ArsC [unclassified Rathayibacter]